MPKAKIKIVPPDITINKHSIKNTGQPANLNAEVEMKSEPKHKNKPSPNE